MLAHRVLRDQELGSSGSTNCCSFFFFSHQSEPPEDDIAGLGHTVVALASSFCSAPNGIPENCRVGNRTGYVGSL